MARVEIMIGRDPKADLRLKNEAASRRHATAWISSDGSVEISDKGSTNGLRLERSDKVRRITHSVLLAGDVVIFGDERIDAREIVRCLRKVASRTPQKPRRNADQTERGGGRSVKMTPERRMPKRKRGGNGRPRRSPRNNALVYD